MARHVHRANPASVPTPIASVVRTIVSDQAPRFLWDIEPIEPAHVVNVVRGRRDVGNRGAGNAVGDVALKQGAIDVQPLHASVANVGGHYLSRSVDRYGGVIPVLPFPKEVVAVTAPGCCIVPNCSTSAGVPLTS